MFKHALKKILLFFFIATFCVILLVGIYRIKMQRVSDNIVSVGSQNALAVAPSSVVPPIVATPKPTPPPTTRQTYTGDTYRTRWGNLTVAIAVQNGKLVSVTTPKLPDSPPSQYAQPILIDQAMQSGSANIQGVSGATSTSIAFQRSLESALVQAGL